MFRFLALSLVCSAQAALVSSPQLRATRSVSRYGQPMMGNTNDFKVRGGGSL